MTVSKRDWLTNLGLSAYLLGLAAWAQDESGDLWQTLDGFFYAMGTIALVTFILRRPRPHAADQRPSTWLLCALSSVYFLAFEHGRAPTWVIALHVLGDASLLYLGRSFSLLPARRELRTGFAYRIVRHPAYATYLLTDAVFVASTPSSWNALVALVGAASLVWRADREERLLSADAAYESYRRTTPHRFIPFVY